ncbi:MAG: hypothetical protein RLZZ59_577 [Pseudomonadota bacterium]
MKKQLIYPSLVRRLFSSVIDLILLSFIMTPIGSMINKHMFLEKFGHILREKNIDVNDYKALAEALQSPEFAQYSNFATMIEIMTPMLIFQAITMILYFTLFTTFWGATPAKYLFRLRVVDEKTLALPSIYQSFIRCMGYCLAPIGVWFIPFSKRKQGLHDHFASTVVVVK